MTDQITTPDGGQELQQTLIDELGLSDISQEKKDALLIKMTEVVLKRIFVETMEKLTAADQAEYEKLINENVAPEKLEEFLKAKISNYDEMINKIVADFKEEMKGNGE
jgi:hypothetical protein